MKSQKVYKSFQTMCAGLLALPAVLAIIPTDPAGKKVATEAMSKGLAAAFNRWYEARASSQFGIHDENNGYPGDVAAFQLALKAGFYAYRYAFPVARFHDALEAIQANLPPVAEIDAYPDNTGPSYMTRQLTGIRALKQKAAAGESLCDCPACRQEKTYGPASGEPPATYENQGEGLPAHLRDNPLARRFADELKKLMSGEGVMDTSYATTRQHLVELGEDLRKAFEKGNLQYVRNFTATSPTTETLQATILRLSEMGFTDVTEKWIRLILEDDPSFTLVPPTDTPKYVAFMEALATYYPKSAEETDYPEDVKAAAGFRLRVLEESISKGKQALVKYGSDCVQFQRVVKVMSLVVPSFRVILAKMQQLGETALAEAFLKGYETQTNDLTLRASLSPDAPDYETLQRVMRVNFG